MANGWGQGGYGHHGGYHPPACPVCRHQVTPPMRMTAHGWAHDACAAQWSRDGRSSLPSQIGKGCAIAFGMVCLVLFAICSGRSKGTDRLAQEAPLGPAPVQHTVAAEWQKDSALWEAIVVPRGTTDAKLCELARWLHKSRWLPRYQFFDDGARVSEYVSWTKAYPAYQRPKPLVDWMRAHHRGLLGPDTADTWELNTVTGDSPASRSEYPCSMPR